MASPTPATMEPALITELAPQKSWKDIAAAKKAEQFDRIPAPWRLEAEYLASTATTVDLRPLAAASGVLSERELEITGETYDATALLAKLADGTYTAVEVVTAFCKRAAIAQQLCNCLTEIMFVEAIAAAEKLDETFKQTGRTVGPLHGLPMTFKECFHVKGFDASDGYISRCFEPSTTTSYLIETIKAAGAVVISKTNTPQTMLVAEAHNNVFGQTRNPVVSHLTCGGSSGGEGSVVAYRGSALGIGTDVGGSIRIPAAANGIYGYKPTLGILPMWGYAASNWAGMNTGVPAVCGPLAHSARDLTMFTKVIRATQPWLGDPAVIPYICEKGVSKRKPVIGLIEQSGLTPHPPILRAVRDAATKLRNAGFEVKEFETPDFAEVGKITRELFTLDGFSYPKREMTKAGEPPVPSVKAINFWDMSAKSPEEMWAWNAKKIGVQKAMLDCWQKAQVDVVLCPAGPHTAVAPGHWKHDIYTVVWNAVDYPAVIIPFTKADPSLDAKNSSFVPLSPDDEEVQGWYDPAVMAGAPASLQIVGPRLGDEQLLWDVEMIDEVLNKSESLANGSSKLSKL